MKILADHCVYGKTIRLLKEANHEVIRLKEVADSTSSDEIVLAIAQSLGAVLISNDKDFADIVKYPPKENKGIIVLRITPQTENIFHRTLLQFLQSITFGQIRGKLIVIRGDKIRRRS